MRSNTADEVQLGDVIQIEVWDYEVDDSRVVTGQVVETYPGHWDLAVGDVSYKYYPGRGVQRVANFPAWGLKILKGIKALAWIS